MNKPKILVTGGAGYIGSVLVPELLKNGFSVTVLDNFMYNQTGLLGCVSYDSFTVVRGDARDERVLRGCLKDADYVIPLAAIVGMPACNADQHAAQSTNLEAIKLLLKLRGKDQRNC